MPDGKQQVLRLYFVDAPESDASFPERITEQAAYFAVTPFRLVGVPRSGEAISRGITRL
jgi:hypothetical protein